MSGCTPSAPLRSLARHLPRLQPSLADPRAQRVFVTTTYAGEWVSLPVNLVGIGLVVWLYGAAADWRLLGPLVLALLLTTVPPMLHALRWGALMRRHGEESPLLLQAAPGWLARVLAFDLGYALTVGLVAVYLIAVRPETTLFVVVGVLMIHLALVIKDICLHFATTALGLMLLGPLAVHFATRDGIEQHAIAVLLGLHLVGTSAFARDLSRAMIEQIAQRFELQRLSADLARARDVAERANIAKSRFFASASHDLRQPMHALTLLASSLARDNRDPAVAPLVRGARRRLERVPGIGPITASALVATVGDATNFDNGRQLAAWLGVVPRQHCSGGKQNLLGMSKRGDAYLRTMLIHGARAVIYRATQKADPRNCVFKGLAGKRTHHHGLPCQPAGGAARLGGPMPKDQGSTLCSRSKALFAAPCPPHANGQSPAGSAHARSSAPNLGTSGGRSTVPRAHLGVGEGG
jgi:hypothetical protein